MLPRRRPPLRFIAKQAVLTRSGLSTHLKDLCLTVVFTNESGHLMAAPKGSAEIRD